MAEREHDPDELDATDLRVWPEPNCPLCDGEGRIDRGTHCDACECVDKFGVES